VDSMRRTIDAELATQSAMERAKGQILAPFLFHNIGTNNGSEVMGPDFTVSVAWGRWYTNTLQDRLTDPSPPVFIDTNRANQNGKMDERFYLDLNRNGTFEETGYVPILGPGNPSTKTGFMVGDPQWIGQLQNPFFPHSATNRYIGRYAFLIQPIG